MTITMIEIKIGDEFSIRKFVDLADPSISIESELPEPIDGALVGGIDTYGALFLQELYTRKTDCDVALAIVQSCFHLSVNIGTLRRCIFDAADALHHAAVHGARGHRKKYDFNPPQHVVEKILEVGGIHTLVCFAEYTTIGGTLDLGNIHEAHITPEIFDVLSDAFDIESIVLGTNAKGAALGKVGGCLRKLTAKGRPGDGISIITDETLVECTQIEELRISCDNHITTLAPFAKKLRVLDISNDCRIFDQQLAIATNLQELNASNNPWVHSLKPFAKTLEVLYLIYESGITNYELEGAKPPLKTLHVSYNVDITRISFLASTLTTLVMCGNVGVNNADLNACTGLTSLDLSNNDRITSILYIGAGLKVLKISGEHCKLGDTGLPRSMPRLEFLVAKNNARITKLPQICPNLTTLIASDGCGLTQAGIAHATNLTSLDISRNLKIHSIAHCAGTLRHLIIDQNTSITDASLQYATRLVELSADQNEKITSVEPFAATLRILSARCECGLTDESLKICRRIEKLDASDNPKITTVAPFAASLRVLISSSFWSRYGGLTNSGIEKAKNLLWLHAKGNDKLSNPFNLSREYTVHPDAFDAF